MSNAPTERGYPIVSKPAPFDVSVALHGSPHVVLNQTSHSKAIPCPQPSLFCLLRDQVVFAELMGISFAKAHEVLGAPHVAAYQGREGSEIGYGSLLSTKFTVHSMESAATGLVRLVPMGPQSIAEVARGR